MSFRTPLVQPRLPNGCDWCEDCDGDGINWVPRPSYTPGEPPSEDRCKCETCDGFGYVEMEEEDVAD